MPPKDPILAPGMFGEGVSGPRHFDFSEAPDVPGFNSSSEFDADYTMGDYGAYMEFLVRGETQTMDQCVPRRLRGAPRMLFAYRNGHEKKNELCGELSCHCNPNLLPSEFVWCTRICSALPS